MSGIGFKLQVVWGDHFVPGVELAPNRPIERLYPMFVQKIGTALREFHELLGLYTFVSAFQTNYYACSALRCMIDFIFCANAMDISPRVTMRSASFNCQVGTIS